MARLLLSTRSPSNPKARPSTGSTSRLAARPRTSTVPAATPTDAAGQRYELDIRNLGDKYDIVLAQGRAVSQGRVIYIFTYGTDLAASRRLALTTSPEQGELAVLNWSPSQWDQPLGHYTATIYWPAEVAGPAVTPEELASRKFLTEPWMNRQYKLDYFGRQFNGKYWLGQRVHWEQVPVEGHLRIQEYIDASVFSSLPVLPQRPAESPSAPETSSPYPSHAPHNVSPAPAIHSVLSIRTEQIRLGSLPPEPPGCCWFPSPACWRLCSFWSWLASTAAC